MADLIIDLAFALAIFGTTTLVLILLIRQEKQMATLQEVTDKLTNLATDVTTLINKPAKGITEADLQPIADGIDALDAQVKTAIG